MCRYDDLRSFGRKVRKECLLNVGVNVCFRLLDQKEVRHTVTGKLDFVFKELEREVDEICASKALLLNFASIAGPYSKSR